MIDAGAQKAVQLYSYLDLNELIADWLDYLYYPFVVSIIAIVGCTGTAD